MTELRRERERSGDVEGVKSEINLLEYTAVLTRHWWLVLGVWLVAVVATFGFTQRMPRVYESTVTLLTPKESGATGLLGSFSSGFLQQVPGLSVPSLTPNRDLVLALLKSRTVGKAAVDRFQLQERYGARYLADAIREVQAKTNITLSREGVIAIKVEDTDPQLAAEMANFYVEQVDRLVAQYGTGEAGKQRVFLSEQLARAKVDLEIGEEALRRFQERNRAIALQDQTRGAIEAAARLKGEIMALEVQLQVMRNFATDANPEVATLRRRIDEMKRQLTQVQYGEDSFRVSPRTDSRRDFTVPLPKVPEMGIELARLIRDMKVQETLVTLLSQQLEQAKIAESRDGPVVQVLDRAVPAERHSRPRLRFNLIIAGVAGFLGGMLLAFSSEYVVRIRHGPGSPDGEGRRSLRSS